MSRERRDAHAPDVLPCPGHRLASRPDTPMDAPLDPTHRWIPHRPVPLARGPGPRECALAQATRGRLPTDHAPTVHPGGSGDARAPRTALPDLAERHTPRPARDHPALAPTSLRALLASQVQAGRSAAADRRRHDRPDRDNGQQEPALGRRADPRGAAEAQRSRRQAHDPAVHAASPAATTARPALVDVSAQPRARNLGLRFPADLRPSLPTDLCVLSDRTRVAAGCARRGDALTVERMGDPAAPRGDGVG
jgi:hypothetical protein